MLTELLDRVTGRCIEDEAGCWNWQGAFQQFGTTPVMGWQGKTMGVRRLIAIAKGRKVEGLTATVKCGNHCCVNPDHILLIKQADLVRRAVKESNFHSRTSYLVANANAQRARSHITAEIAALIREAPGKHREIAERYGVTKTMVSKIKLGLQWRELTNNPWMGLFRGK